EAVRAVQAARANGAAWREMTAKARSAILRRWYELVVAHTDSLAELLSAEQGKPLAESRGEVAYGASFLEWFAEEAKRAYGDVIPAHLPGKRLLATLQPIGVVA